MSKPLCILRVNDVALESWQTDNPEPIRHALFAAGDHVAFGQWLARQPKRMRYRLLVDLADEGIQLETLPRARGADRRALIARRFASHFPSSPITWMRALGPQTDNQRFERLVMHGLTRPTALEPWLDVIRRSGIRLEAICSATVLLGHFVLRALHLDSPVLLATHHLDGTRLTLIGDGCAKFSRTVPGVTPDSDGWLREVERTRAYLATQHGSTGEPLRTIALVDARDRDRPTSAEHGIEFAAVATLLSHRDVRQPASASTHIPSIESALLQWLVLAPTRLHCRAGACPTAPGPSSRRLAALGGATALLALGLILTAARWTEAGRLDQAASALEQRSAEQRRELAELRTRHASLATPPEALLELIARIDREQTAHTQPLSIFALAAEALDAMPGAEIDHLAWQRMRSAPAAEAIGVDVRLRIPAGHAQEALAQLTEHLSAQGAQVLDSETDVASAPRSPDDVDAASVRARIRFQFDSSARR